MQSTSTEQSGTAVAAAYGTVSQETYRKRGRPNFSSYRCESRVRSAALFELRMRLKVRHIGEPVSTIPLYIWNTN